MAFIPLRTIEIDSKDRNNGTSTEFTLYLKSVINLPHKDNLFCRMENVRMPISYYEQNSNYNTFTITEYNGATTNTVSVSVPIGSYNISELMTQLETQLNSSTTQTNTFDFTLNEINGLITIGFSGGTSTIVTIKSTGSLNNFLGFSITSDTASSGSSIIGTEYAETKIIKFMKFICSNLIQGHYHTSSKTQSVMLFMPIEKSRGDYQIYENHDGDYIPLSNTNNIYSLDLRIMDNNENLIDLNYKNWIAKLVIYEHVNNVIEDRKTYR